MIPASLTPSPGEIAAALKLIELAKQMRDMKRDNPLPHVQWLPGQMAFLTSTASIALYRAGGQHSGKTWAGAAELIWRMIGKHPFKEVKPGPIRAWCVAGTGDQVGVVQRKVWDLVPKHLVAPGCRFDSRKGAFVGRVPGLRLINGSECTFKSGGADLLNLASDTLDYIWNDEPPDSEDAFNEFCARLLKSRGDIRITMTPAGRPVGWLRKRVEEGKPGDRNSIVDLHFPLTAANMIPVGQTKPLRLGDGTVCDQAWIDDLIGRYSPEQVPVRVHGGWEYATTTSAFRDVWNPTTMVTNVGILGKGIVLLLGVDHGKRMGKQVAYLIQLERIPSTDPQGDGVRIHVLDEYVDTTGKATPRQDARGLLAMLKRHGAGWHNLDEAFGDRVHAPGTAERKSNEDLSVELGKLLGMKPEHLAPQLWTVKRGEGAGDEGHAQWPGVRWLKHLMAMNRFSVDPRCVRLIEALPKFTGADDDWKDPIDALRYGCKSYIYESVKQNTVTLDMSR